MTSHMDNNKYHDDLIQKYVDGELDSPEKKEFAKLVEEHPNLIKDANSIIELQVGLEALGVEQLKGEIGQWEKEMSSPKKIFRLRKVLSIAASVLILVAASIALFIAPNSKDDLFQTYYQPYQDLITSRAANATLLTRGMEAYNQENYERAIQDLTKYINLPNPDPGANLYLAISLLEKEQFDSSREKLNQLIDQSLYQQQAQWYILLSYLSQNRTAEALTVAQELSTDSGHYKHQEAQEILNQLAR